ncbi:MAG: class I SAM-dependent methyltransferase [Solirubrobacterales bacterium]|nr:class I SAM-dependent methyltransferase [Solirubrobacterales bacterium]
MTKAWNRHVTHAEEIARGPGFRDLRDRIIELAAPQPGEVAVDVGSGTGLLSLALAAHVDQVWAIDISPSMADYLRTKAASAGLDNIQAAVASAVSLPLVDESADLVVSNYCVHHVDEDDKRRALHETMRVLRPGGRLVFGDMMFDLALGDLRNQLTLSSRPRSARCCARAPRASCDWRRTGCASRSATGSAPRRRTGGGRRSPTRDSSTST